MRGVAYRSAAPLIQKAGVLDRYTYKFVWKNPDGTFQTKYLDAPDRDAAILDFEATFRVNMKTHNVVMKRLTGGDKS